MKVGFKGACIMAVILFLIGVFNTVSFASDPLEGRIVDVPIYINNIQIDQSKMSHPILDSDQIIYVPISTGFMYAVGLSIDFYTGRDGEDELWLERLYVNSEYDLYPVENMPVSGAVTLTHTSNKVYIENHRIATELEGRPPVLYNYLTYIPLTDGAKRAFKWDVTYDNNALRIDVPAFDYKLDKLSVASQFLEFFEDLVYFEELDQYWDTRITMQRQQRFESYYYDLVRDNKEQVQALLDRAAQLDSHLEEKMVPMQSKAEYEKIIADKARDYQIKRRKLLSKDMQIVEDVKTYAAFNAQGKAVGETLRVGETWWEVGLMDAGRKTGEWYTQNDEAIYITTFDQYGAETGPVYYQKEGAVYYYQAVYGGFASGLVEIYYEDGRRSRAEFNTLGERMGIDYTYDAQGNLIDYALYEDTNGQPVVRVYTQTLEDGTLISGFEGQDETGYPLRVWYPLSGEKADEGITQLVFNENYLKNHSIETRYFSHKPPEMEVKTDGAQVYLNALNVGTFVLEDMYSGGQGYIRYPDGIIYSGVIDYELPTGQGTYYFDGGNEMQYLDETLESIISDDMTRSEQIEAVYDWILDHIDPVQSFSLDELVVQSQGHLGLLEGQTTYFGYHELFRHFMYKLGYVTALEYGQLQHEKLSSYGAHYVWTKMIIDGEPVYFDPFLDDALNNSSDRKAFFYLNKSEIELTHVPAEADQ